MKHGLYHTIWLPALLLCVGMVYSHRAMALNSDTTKTISTRNDTAAVAASLQNKGFKTLFTSSIFDPAQPYTAQLNPKVVPFVDDYMQKHRKHLESLRITGAPYFRLIDQILRAHGLPSELKYLAVIESNLQSYAISWAGAVGPWQFMPETGRNMGLVVNYYRDDRTDYYRSTHAAAKYLRYLYNDLGDWLLVIAAYNGGPARVNSAIKKTGSRSFWDIQHLLPEESRTHVKKFIATHFIMEGSGGITTTGRDEWNAYQQDIQTALVTRPSLTPEQLASTDTLQIQGKYNSVVLCNETGMDILAFNQLNPGFDIQVSTDNGYPLRLPKDKLEKFKANRYNILRLSIVNNIERISKGNTGYPDPDKLKKPAPKSTGKSK